MKRIRTWLSIDWDFFVRSLGVWDWAHRESPFFMGGAMWQIRMGDFCGKGIDLVEEMDPARHARPDPRTFWDVLVQLGYDFGETQYVVVADSHAAAGPVFYEVFQRYDEPDVLINFDAHHDVGYCEYERIMERALEGVCTCDMWLGALMTWIPELRARIIFPNWMEEEGLTIEDQEETIEGHGFPNAYQHRIEMGYFEEDGAVNPLVGGPDVEHVVEAIFICRSSAWTPPWLDEDFIQFVSGCEDVTGIEPFNRDDEYEGPTNALKVREDFSIEAAKAMGEHWKQLMSGQFKPEEDD